MKKDHCCVRQITKAPIGDSYRNSNKARWKIVYSDGQIIGNSMIGFIETLLMVNGEKVHLKSVKL